MVAVEKLKTTLMVLGTFKSYYHDYKARSNTETPDNPWRFQNSALFSRLDSYFERCHDILDLTQTVVQFSKLEKVSRFPIVPYTKMCPCHGLYPPWADNKSDHPEKLQTQLQIVPLPAGRATAKPNYYLLTVEILSSYVGKT